MTSETRTAYGSRVLRHGSSRPCAPNHSRSAASRSMAVAASVYQVQTDIVEETVAVSWREVRIARPRDVDALLDEDAFEHEEFLPYWAELWPSGLALAAAVAELDLRDARTVELGCGLAVPSVVAALQGAEALATDWSHDALRFAARNARLNGVVVESLLCSWTAPKPLIERAPFDLV